MPPENFRLIRYKTAFVTWTFYFLGTSFKHLHIIVLYDLITHDMLALLLVIAVDKFSVAHFSEYRTPFYAKMHSKQRLLKHAQACTSEAAMGLHESPEATSSNGTLV